MDFKVNREIVSAAECVYEGMQEQGVELDYILPDYYPDIFKLVRCEVSPVVTDYTVSGDKLSYELRCDIKILYCSESGSVLQCVSQRQNFSKTVDFGRSCENPTVKLIPKADHINYRAVNKRRLDVRGAVSVKIKVEGEKNQEVICDAFGLNVQVRKVPVRYAARKLTAEKTLQIAEETELSSVQPPIANIVNCRCRTSECEKKMISGKLLAKGEADVKLLYSCEKDGEGALEPLEFSVPYSQIIDMDGIDDSFDCNISAEVVSCDITPSADKNGDNRIIKCELELRLICRAVKAASVMLGTDAYSTVHPCEVVTADIRAEQIPVIYSESFRNNAKICEGENVPQNIYSMWCVPKNINTRISEDGKTVIISGMLTYTMAAKDGSGMIVMPDKDEAFEETIELGDEIPGAFVNADIEVTGVSYNISSDNVLTAKADISAKISVYSSSSVRALSDIAIDDSVKKIRDGDYSIKLYYGVENEEVWDIAKRYSTCVSAVMEENELAGERLESCGMLLIPIVN
ncbi:MAG: DUF3794 domain-containing protein [Ruminococcus sp.]|nr:DUF3794 domain-containing protein [Ruminococcus sp.]